MKKRSLGSMRKIAGIAAIALVMLVPPFAAFAAAGSGTSSVTPLSDVSAGSSGTWTFRYTAADTFISGTLEIVIPDGWSAPQIADPYSAGYVTVSSSGTLGATPLAIAGRVITVYVTALDTAQTVDVVYGDQSIDAGGRSIAQTAVESAVEFAMSSDPAGETRSPLALSPSLDVVAGSIAKLTFTTPQRTFTADNESAVMRVRAEDEFGNPSSVAGDQSVDLSTSAASGMFSHLGGGDFAETGAVAILAGEDTASFYYRDIVAGDKTITASAGGQSWTDAQQTVTVNAGIPFRLAVSPEDTTAVAGDYVRYRLRVEDEEGNPSALSNSQAISLLGYPGDFYTTSNHGTPITQITIASGAHTVYVDYRNTNKQMEFPPYVLAFLDDNGVSPTLEAASATIYVDSGPFDPATSEIEVSKSSAIANGADSIAIIVRARDAYYNGVGGAAVLIASTGSGNTLHQPVGTTSGTGSAEGSIRSTKAEAKTITATLDGVDIVPSSDVTFTAGPFDAGVSSVAVSKATVVANGVDSTVVTVTVSDAQGNPISGSTVAIGA
ncbi:MAG: Ig-like domain-containing protein, partial [Candidatus Krumholzibacteria bacterium]|nr:Ig-like domain-containing protein [Candidatus Krumholzibacteria bacterium]